MKPGATTKPMTRNGKIVSRRRCVACQIRLYTLLGVRFALQKEKQKTRTNRCCQSKIAKPRSADNTTRLLTNQCSRGTVMATAILSPADAPEGYRPFKCVSCGLEGMAQPSARKRIYCNVACANRLASEKKKAESRARKQAAKAARAAIPPPCSKACTKCGEVKSISEFSKDSRNGHKASCKTCRNTAAANYNAANKDAKAARDLKRRTDLESRARWLAGKKLARDAARALSPGWNKRVKLHDAHVKARLQLRTLPHDAHVLALRKPVLHDAHVKEFKSDNTRYLRWKYHNVPRQMLYHRIKGWMHKHLGDKLPSRKWSAKLGYTTEELRQHLERQFTKGMSWENKGLWHIDHIRPVSSFDISSIDDPAFLDCFGLHNLRPLWARDNLKKSAKYEFLL